MECLISENYETCKFSWEEDWGGSGDRLKSLFDQVLQVFLSYMSGKKYIADTPALLGDGKPIDLFKLFRVVWRGGGFDSVSQHGLWDLVAEECGVKDELLSSMKLIYMTYLNDLDQWLEPKLRENREIKVGGRFSLFLLELKKEIRGSLCGKPDGKTKDGDFEFRRTKKWQYKGSETAKRELNSPDASGSCTVDDDEKDLVEGIMDISVSEATVSKQKPHSSKRKRASLSLSLPGMLNWVKDVAKNPRDLAIGRLPEPAKWKECSTDEFWLQALLVREACLMKLPDASNIGEPSQQETNLPKKQKMNPSMYADNNVQNHQSRERQRCSGRVSSSTKSRFCPCCTSTNKAAACQKESKPKEEDTLHVQKIPKKRNVDITDEKSREKQVRVGPLFQAQVPEWAGPVSESDPKWLGTRMWPPEDGRQALDSVGEGRNDSCRCDFPGFVGCARFHIAEKRLKLKLEIGKLFFTWRFHLMGEEVALRWTNEEEKRFKEMIKIKSPSPYKSVSGCSFKYFRGKTRAELVSYYFNVHLARRRAYQNRVTPKEVDSDDDEKEVGSIGVSYGDDETGSGASGSKEVLCVESTECTDY